MFRGRILLVLLGMIGVPLASADIIDGEEFVDPTRPLLSTRASAQVSQDGNALTRLVPTRYEVTFVRAGSSTPMAVVNDQRVTLGDVVGQATVVAIDRSGVTLRLNNQEQRIPLFSTDVKRAAATGN